MTVSPTLIAILCAGVMLGACGDDASEDRDNGGARPTSAPAMSEVSVVVDDDAIEIDGSVEAEPTKLIARNDGKDPHQVYLARLNEGVTPEDVREALKKNPEALFEMITVAGSFPGEGTNFGRVSPGKTGELTIDFPEGTYMVLDPEVEGPPPLGIFEVGPATGGDVPEPDADYVVETGDFYFKIDNAQVGPSVVKITNDGAQGHEVSVAEKVKGGEGEEVAFMFGPPPGGALWTMFDLHSGTYEVVCFFPDVKTGKPHFKLGMETTLKVK